MRQLADLFLHASESGFLQELIKNKDKKLAHTFYSSFRCIDDVLSLNNSRFGDYYLYLSTELTTVIKFEV
jgi:hypothetical protein